MVHSRHAPSRVSPMEDRAHVTALLSGLWGALLVLTSCQSGSARLPEDHAPEPTSITKWTARRPNSLWNLRP